MSPRPAEDRCSSSPASTAFVPATSQEPVKAAASPGRAYRRWCEVLGHHERYPSTRMLAEAIGAVGGIELTGYDRHLDPAGQQPLLTPIDRWEHPAGHDPAHRAGNRRHRSNASGRASTCPPTTPCTDTAPSTGSRTRTVGGRPGPGLLRTRNTRAKNRTTFSTTSIPPSPTSKPERTHYWSVSSTSSNPIRMAR